MSGQPKAMPPAGFVEEIERHFGAEGRAWLASLPDRIADISRRWSLTVDGAPRHGAHALVIPVTRGNERFALKIAHPDETFAAELAGLRAWGGHGTVEVVDVLPSEGIMMLEWLDASKDLTSLPIDEAIIKAGLLTRRLAITPPPNISFPTTCERAAEIATTLAPRSPIAAQPRPQTLSYDLLDHAVLMAQSLSSMTASWDMSCLTTWDLHSENVLRGVRAGWTMTDPMPLIGTPEVTLAPFLWTRTEEISGPGHLSHLIEAYVAAGNLNPDLTRRWLIVRLVDYWLWGLGGGLTIDPMRCRTLLTWLADRDGIPFP